MDSGSNYGDSLRVLSRPGELYRKKDSDQSLECTACAHRCRIKPGASGICRMRFSSSGELMVPWGYVSSLACDPIEKKPFYHFYPGEDALSFGMLGCNFRCPFCQNWHISQTLRDSKAKARPRQCSASDLVEQALSRNTSIVSSTYNEPLISSEWSGEIFSLAKEQGLATCYVSNGYASMEVLDYLDPWLDAMNIDIKCFTEEGYRSLGGRLEPVLDTVRSLWQRGKWIEVITLVVPGFNDEDSELRSIAEFLVSVSPDIPWHLSAYHPAYRRSGGASRTPFATLQRAAEIGREAGVRYIYFGNVGGVGDSGSTYCHSCGCLLIERAGFVRKRCAVEDGTCPSCGTSIPGRWRTA